MSTVAVYGEMMGTQTAVGGILCCCAMSSDSKRPEGPEAKETGPF